MEGSWRHRQHGAIKVAHLKDAKVVNGSLVFGQSQALQNEGNIRMEVRTGTSFVHTITAHCRGGGGYKTPYS